MTLDTQTGFPRWGLLVTLLVMAASAKLMSPALAQEPTDNLSTLEDKLPKNKVIATVSVGVSPLGLAVTPNGDAVYVANSHSNNVSVIQTSSNTVIATVPVGNTPTHVAITANGSIAFVTNFIDNTISEIYTGSNTVINTFPVIEYFPSGLAVRPDAKQLYVVTQNYPGRDGFVSIIDTNNLSPLNVLRLDGNPIEVCFNPDGKLAYVLIDKGYRNSFIAEIDTVSQTIVQLAIGLGDFSGAPNGLAISPDGATLYASEPFNFVLAFNTADDSLKERIPIFPQKGKHQVSEPAVTPNGEFLYVPAPYRNTVTMVDTATNKIVGSPITVGVFPLYLAVARNGDYLYSSNNADDTVSVIDIRP